MTIQQEVKADPKAEKFTMIGAPVLAKGRHDKVLAQTEGFAARVKVYAEGGENATHAHLNEDHLFIVLGGQATFCLGREGEEVIVADKYDGVFIPRSAYYRFLSSGDENLVMLRVGAFDGENRDRVGPDGRELLGNSAENLHVEGVPVPGTYFTR